MAFRFHDMDFRARAVATAAGALLVCMMASFGACSGGDKKPKTPVCHGNKDCKAGTVCVDNKCAECGADTDCPKGKRCDLKANACIEAPECKKDSDCTGGKVCQAGACKVCASDGECASGHCSAGACAPPKACSKDDECADDEDCVGGFCKKGGGRNVTPGDVSCQLQTIYFGFDDSSIKQSEQDRLVADQSCMDKNKAKNVFVVGHTDTSGTEEYNIALSERRAQSVADYLARLRRRSGPAAGRAQGRNRTNRPRRRQRSPRGVPVALKHLLPILLSGCFWTTTKSEGQALRKDVTTLQDRINAKEKALDDQVAQLNKILEDATKALKRNGADLGADVDALRNDVREAKGLVTAVNAAVNDLKTAVDTYKKTNDARLDALDQRVAQLESGKPATNASADDLWRLGKQAFEAAKYTDAIEIFKRLVTTYPTYARAAEAQYFRGLSYTNLKDWDHAIGAYQVLVDKYPDSELADDGLFFSAQAAQELKNCTEARAYLGVIKQKYPKSNVLKQANDLDALIKKNQKDKNKCTS